MLLKAKALTVIKTRQLGRGARPLQSWSSGETAMLHTHAHTQQGLARV